MLIIIIPSKPTVVGLNPIAGTTIYQLGSPLFNSAEIDLGEKSLKIIADNYSEENIYVKEVYLNDTPLDRRWVNHAEIENGRVLRFIMSNNPEY